MARRRARRRGRRAHGPVAPVRPRPPSSRRSRRACRRSRRTGIARDPVWRDGLAVLSTASSATAAPGAGGGGDGEPARPRAPTRMERLADDFLRGGVDPADAGAAFYVAAALQVYFTRLAATLPVAACGCSQRGLCPCCGSTPVSGVITASGRTPGARYLHCSLCATAWNHVRAVCITCGGIAHARAAGNRGRFRRCQGRDLRRVPHLREDASTRRRTRTSTLSPTTSRRSASTCWSPKPAGRATRPIRCCWWGRAAQFDGSGVGEGGGLSLNPFAMSPTSSGGRKPCSTVATS